MNRFRLVPCLVLLGIYTAMVLTATMWPTPLDQGYASSIARLLALLHRNGIPEWFGYNKLEFSANVLMFIPLGFLLTLALSRRWAWMSIVLVPVFSGLIEYTQGEFLAQRFATVRDVIANSIGGYIGAVAAAALRALVHARDRLVIERALGQQV